MKNRDYNFDYDRSKRKKCPNKSCIAYFKYVEWLEKLEFPYQHHTMEMLRNFAYKYNTSVRNMLLHKDHIQPRNRSVFRRGLNPFQNFGRKNEW
jgi:hypothetical protein